MEHVLTSRYTVLSFSSSDWLPKQAFQLATNFGMKNSFLGVTDEKMHMRIKFIITHVNTMKNSK